MTWAPRLDALRGTILGGQGHYADAAALLAPAMKTMQEQHTPSRRSGAFHESTGERTAGFRSTLKSNPMGANILDHRSKPGCHDHAATCIQHCRKS
jgi:hypothetical protein